MEVAAASPVAAQEGMPGGRVSLFPAVFGFFGDRVSQDKSQGGVVVLVVVAIEDTHTDPGKGSAAEEVEEEGAPVSSSVPCHGSTCLDLDRVVEGECHESVTVV